ncbi:MAG: DUF2339 domain-containing protein [Candidatus Melainabacteria bacterium]|nr:DUF2339 domain-containing protein [Candidatus Melainabacteria bacterium]
MSQQTPEETGLAGEVRGLKAQVASLTELTGKQESRIAALELKNGIVTKPLPEPVPTVPPVIKPAPVDPPGVPVESKPDAPPVVPKPTTPPVPTEPWGDYLTRKAPVILSRVGVAVVVVGLCYAVGYSWQYFGAIFKILAGFGTAAAFVAGGEVFSRKKNWGWYGQAITGGGYALAYFVMYAAQNIESVKVLDDPLLAMWGLLVIAGASMAHSVARRSEAMALLSTLLAFGTISLSAVSGFTVLATVVLMVGLSIVVVRQRWYSVYGLACSGSYLTYLLFTQPQIEAVGGASGFWLSAGFLATFWLVWNVVSFRLFASRDHATEGGDVLEVLTDDVKALKPRFLFGVSLLNGAAFIAASLYAIASVYADSVYILLAGLGAAYFATAIAARAVAWKENAVVSSFVGLALVSSALAMKLDPTATLAVWFFEVPLLVFIGLRNKYVSFRAFALTLAVVSLGKFVIEGELYNGTPIFDYIVTIPHNVLVGGFAACALGVTSFLYRRVVRVGDWGLSAADFAAVGYAVAALGLVWGLTLVQAPAYATAAILAVEALILGLAAQRLYLATTSAASKVYLGTALVAALATASQIALPQIAIVLGITFAFAALYRTGRFATFVMAGRNGLIYVVLTVAGIITGLLLTYLKVDANALPVVASIEALVLLAVGFAVRDPIVRAASNVAAALAALGLLAILGSWSWLVVIPTVVTLYAIYAAHRFLSARQDVELNKVIFEEVGAPDFLKDLNLSGFYSLAGTVLLTVSFMNLLSWQHLAVALAIEGFALIGSAFLVRDRQFLLSALAVFGLLVGKLALYDLTDAEPIWRIISFVLGGLFMLAAAFLGGKFNKMFAPVDDTRGDTTPRV